MLRAFQRGRYEASLLGGGGGAAPSSILTGLIAYWKHDEFSDGSAPVQRNDSVGSNHLSDAAQCLSTAGKISNGVVISATKKLTIADNPDLSMGDIDFEMWGWVKITTGITNFKNVFVLGKWTPQNEYLLSLYSSGGITKLSWSTRYADNSGGATVLSDTYGNIAVGTVVFFSVYHDSINNLIGVAVNNGAFNTAANAQGVRNSTSPFEIGGGDAAAGVAWADEIGVMKNRLLTASERTELYNAGAGKTYPF